jgi:hypothetical protein
MKMLPSYSMFGRLPAFCASFALGMHTLTQTDRVLS